MPQARLLIAEDEERMRRLLGMLLSNADYELDLAADGRDALEKFDEQAPDVLITDLRMPRMSGMELIQEVRQRDPDIPIIVITAFGSIDSAVEAMRAGANNYITKPFEETQIKVAIEHALSTREVMRENRILRSEVHGKFAFENIVTEDKRMLRILDLAKEAAPTNTTVMIYGESGTGKELVTRAIHEASPRNRGAFVAINCAAIPENLLESELFGHERGSFTGATEARKGRFEQADGGTLFLDEIGEMALSLQAKVLRAIETREFQRVGGLKTIRTDIRIIAATNKNLRTRVANKEFRDDLFYRLNVFPVVLPALRERPDDIIPLVEHFLKRFGAEMGKKVPPISPEAQQVLLEYAWPGNVRELQNTIERAMILLKGDTLTPDVLHLDVLEGLEDLESGVGDAPATAPSLGPTVNPAALPRKEEAAVDASASRWHPFRIPEVGFDLETHERDLIAQAMERSKNNKAAAARLLGLSRATFRYRLNKFEEQSAKEESESNGSAK